MRAAVAVALAAIVLAGCGAHEKDTGSKDGIPRSLIEEVRPIGAGPRFHPSVSGPVFGSCRRGLGERAAAHVEVFAADRVVIVPAGIGTRPPRQDVDGRIESARCFGKLVTLDPTGVVLVRRGSHATLFDLFRSWGQPLSTSQVASFQAKPSGPVRVYVDGRRSNVKPGLVPLRYHSEIVIEIGPYVPPHSHFTFAPITHVG